MRLVKYLTNENTKLAEILPTVAAAQSGDETLSRAQVYDWSKSLKKGLINTPHARRPRTYVKQENAEQFVCLIGIRDNRGMPVRELV
jgi:hypothetical protein